MWNKQSPGRAWDSSHPSPFICSWKQKSTMTHPAAQVNASRAQSFPPSSPHCFLHSHLSSWMSWRHFPHHNIALSGCCLWISLRDAVAHISVGRWPGSHTPGIWASWQLLKGWGCAGWQWPFGGRSAVQPVFLGPTTSCFQLWPFSVPSPRQQ